MLILGGTCRLIAEIESGDRFVKRTRVVPINVHPNPGRRVQMQQRHPGTIPQPADAATVTRQNNTGTPSSEDSEDGPTRSIARKNWAKVNPKYNPVFSLLD